MPYAAVTKNVIEEIKSGKHREVLAEALRKGDINTINEVINKYNYARFVAHKDEIKKILLTQKTDGTLLHESLVESALDRNTPLGKIMWFQRGFSETSLESGNLQKLSQALSTSKNTELEQLELGMNAVGLKDNLAKVEANSFDFVGTFYTKLSDTAAKPQQLGNYAEKLKELAKKIGGDLLEKVQKLKQANNFNQKSFAEVADQVNQRRDYIKSLEAAVTKKSAEIRGKIEQCTEKLRAKETEVNNIKFDPDGLNSVQRAAAGAMKIVKAAEQKWVDCENDPSEKYEVCDNHHLCKREIIPRHYDSYTGDYIDDQYSGKVGYYKTVPAVFIADNEARDAAKAKLPQMESALKTCQAELDQLEQAKNDLEGQHIKAIAELSLARSQYANEEAKSFDTIFDKMKPVNSQQAVQEQNIEEEILPVRMEQQPVTSSETVNRVDDKKSGKMLAFLPAFFGSLLTHARGNSVAKDSMENSAASGVQDTQGTREYLPTVLSNTR